MTITSALTGLGLRAARQGDNGDFRVRRAGRSTFAVILNDAAVETVMTNQGIIIDVCHARGTPVTVRQRTKHTPNGSFRRAYVEERRGND